MLTKYMGFALLWPGLTGVSILFRGEACKSLGLFTVACLSQLFGGMVLLALHKFSGKTITVPSAHKWSLLKYSFYRGIAGDLLFIMGIGMSSGLNGVFIGRTEAFLVLLCEYLICGVSITAGQFLLMSLGIVSCIFFSTGTLGLSGLQVGDLFIFLAHIFYALSYILGANLSKTIGALSSIVVSQLIGGIALLPLAVWEIGKSGWGLSGDGLINLLWAALLFHVLSVPIWLMALQKVPSWLVATLGALGPLCAAPVAWLFFGLTLTNTQLIAGSLVVLTSAMLALSNKPTPTS